MLEILNRAMLDPADIYEEPINIVEDISLSKKEKLRILKNWGNEVQHVLESGAENMCVEHDWMSEEQLLQKIRRTMDIVI